MCVCRTESTLICPRGRRREFIYECPLFQMCRNEDAMEKWLTWRDGFIFIYIKALNVEEGNLFCICNMVSSVLVNKQVNRVLQPEATSHLQRHTYVISEVTSPARRRGAAVDGVRERWLAACVFPDMFVMLVDVEDNMKEVKDSVVVSFRTI